MRHTRKVTKIRFGKKDGLLTAFIEKSELNQLDPFVLWDHFSASEVIHSTGLDYHGHSGVDALSYPVIGKMRHHDSAGCHTTLASGDLQIMTAGSGIIHKDIMTPNNGQVESFSLWTALPAGQKEMTKPESCYFHAQDLPIIEEHDSTTKVIVGTYQAHSSPAHCSVPLTYLDIMLAPFGVWFYTPDTEQTSGFVFIRSGSIYVAGSQLFSRQMATLEKAALPIEVRTGKVGAQFFVVLGKPLHQPFYASPSSIHSSQENLSKAEQNILQLMATRK